VSRPAAPVRGADQGLRWPAALTPVVFLVLAVAWTWPALTAPGLLGRKPDAAGTAWFISAAPRLLHGLHDPLTGWPLDVHYGRTDSFVLLGLGALLQPLDPARAHSLVALVGVVLSAWAAEAFARALGARPPWSLLAGTAFAMSGLASTALLEGYVYHLFDPWLPLLAWSWYRATRPGGTALHGVVAGLMFVLCLLTTAWLGLAALPLVVGLLVAGLLRQGRATRPGPIVAAGLTVLLPAALYLALFLAGGGGGQDRLDLAGNPSRPFLWGVVSLAGPLSTVDVGGNSQANTLPAVALVLTMAAPVVLRERQGWRGVALTGLLALAASLTPALIPSMIVDPDPHGLAKAISVLGASLLRFPDRLGWSFLLCAGAVGALVATELAARAARPPWPLLLMALVDAFGILRMPWRQQVALDQAPSAYAAARGPVLDLWPEEVSTAPSWELRTTNTDCFYQARHGRPITDLCIASPTLVSPRVRLGQWVNGQLLEGQDQEVGARLGALGFSTLVLHADFFAEADRQALEEGLARIDPAPARSTDGGELVLAYQIPVMPGADPAQAWAAWAR